LFILSSTVRTHNKDFLTFYDFDAFTTTIVIIINNSGNETKGNDE